mgnify:CR=1 FL=1
MYVYRISLTIEDEVLAETKREAWKQFTERIREGFYGPTINEVEEIEEVESSPDEATKD